MQHKAQDIFNYFEMIFKIRKEKGHPNPHHTDYLIPANTSLMYVVMPCYDHFDKEQLGYIEILIRDKVDEKDVMKFSINSAGGMVVRDGFDVEGVKYPQEDHLNLMIERLFMMDKYQCPISVKEIEPIPPGSNPYRHDEWRQGASISKFWEVMFTNASNGDIENVRFIHTKTGRRFSLDLYEAEKPVTEKQQSMENNDEKLAG